MAAVTETPPNPGSPDMHPCKTDNFGNRDILVGRGKMVNIHRESNTLPLLIFPVSPTNIFLL
jgi:hypothetical protein